MILDYIRLYKIILFKSRLKVLVESQPPYTWLPGLAVVDNIFTFHPYFEIQYVKDLS